MGKPASKKKLGKPPVAAKPAAKGTASKGASAKAAAAKGPVAKKPVAGATTATRNGRAHTPAKGPTKPAGKPATTKSIGAKVVAAKPAPAAKPAAKPVVSVKPIVAAKPAGPAKPTLIIKPSGASSPIGKKPVPPPAEPRRDARSVRAQKPSRYESNRYDPSDRVVRPTGPVLAPIETANSSGDSKPKKNQAGLSSRELDVFRDMLLAKRRELVGDMSSMEKEALAASEGNLSSLPIHMADMGTDNYEQEFTLGLVEKDRNLLREINYALAKIQAGTFGLCEGTGKPIAKVRLEAQPWARFSIEHARSLEKGRMIR